jgi:hypothetical protein
MSGAMFAEKYRVNLISFVGEKAYVLFDLFDEESIIKLALFELLDIVWVLFIIMFVAVDEKFSGPAYFVAIMRSSFAYAS